MATKYKLLKGELVAFTDAEKTQAETDVKRWDNDATNRKKQELRDTRVPLLEEADHKINTLVDNGGDATSWRTYRQELRDITKASDLDNVTFPDKPS